MMTLSWDSIAMCCALKFSIDIGRINSAQEYGPRLKKYRSPFCIMGVIVEFRFLGTEYLWMSDNLQTQSLTSRVGMLI